MVKYVLLFVVVVLSTLKVTNVIQWRWIWVTAAVWIPLVLFAIMAVFMATVMWLADKPSGSPKVPVEQVKPLVGIDQVDHKTIGQ